MKGPQRGGWTARHPIWKLLDFPRADIIQPQCEMTRWKIKREQRNHMMRWIQRRKTVNRWFQAASGYAAMRAITFLIMSWKVANIVFNEQVSLSTVFLKSHLFFLPFFLCNSLLLLSHTLSDTVLCYESSPLVHSFSCSPGRERSEVGSPLIPDWITLRPFWPMAITGTSIDFWDAMEVKYVFL